MDKTCSLRGQCLGVGDIVIVRLGRNMEVQAQVEAKQLLESLGQEKEFGREAELLVEPPSGLPRKNLVILFFQICFS